MLCVSIHYIHTAKQSNVNPPPRKKTLYTQMFRKSLPFLNKILSRFFFFLILHRRIFMTFVEHILHYEELRKLAPFKRNE